MNIVIFTAFDSKSVIPYLQNSQEIPSRLKLWIRQRILMELNFSISPPEGEFSISVSFHLFYEIPSPSPRKTSSEFAEILHDSVSGCKNQRD